MSAGLHAAEEYLTGWQAWARQALGIVMPTTIPSATLVTGLFFHILPTIVQGRVSPGVYTAVLLYLPFSSWALIGAARDGVPRGAIATGVGAGTLMMLSVVMVARWLTGGG